MNQNSFLWLYVSYFYVAVCVLSKTYHPAQRSLTHCFTLDVFRSCLYFVFKSLIHFELCLSEVWIVCQYQFINIWSPSIPWCCWKFCFSTKMVLNLHLNISSNWGPLPEHRNQFLEYISPVSDCPGSSHSSTPSSSLPEVGENRKKEKFEIIRGCKDAAR